MSNSNILLNLLESILGTGDKTSKGNYKFHCPNCHHPKKKLEINNTLLKYHINIQ